MSIDITDAADVSAEMENPAGPASQIDVDELVLAFKAECHAIFRKLVFDIVLNKPVPPMQQIAQICFNDGKTIEDLKGFVTLCRQRKEGQALLAKAREMEDFDDEYKPRARGLVASYANRAAFHRRQAAACEEAAEAVRRKLATRTGETIDTRALAGRLLFLRPTRAAERRLYDLSQPIRALNQFLLTGPGEKHPEELRKMREEVRTLRAHVEDWQQRGRPVLSGMAGYQRGLEADLAAAEQRLAEAESIPQRHADARAQIERLRALQQEVFTGLEDWQAVDMDRPPHEVGPSLVLDRPDPTTEFVHSTPAGPAYSDEFVPGMGRVAI
jgi:hypothetical protein